MTLAELFRKHGSDKDADSGEEGHCYGVLYEMLLAGKRESVRNVLEIGVLDGASLRAWRDWLPNAAVVGMDRDAKRLFSEERITCVLADQKDQPSVLSAAGGREWDLILDDGSHLWKHQMDTLRTLFPLLRPGGDYLIEDVGVLDTWKATSEAREFVLSQGGEFAFYDLRPFRGRHDDVVFHAMAGPKDDRRRWVTC